MTTEEATICRIFLEDVAGKYKNCEEYKLLMNAVNTKPCEDAIRRQAVINTLDSMDKALDVDRTVDNYKALLKECFENLTPVYPKAKTGHWRRVTDKTGHLVWECDKCGWQQRLSTNNCPNCGAKMESKE